MAISVLPNTTCKQSCIDRRRTSQSAGHQSYQTLPANSQAYIEEGHQNQLAISLTKHYLKQSGIQRRRTSQSACHQSYKTLPVNN
ncbi:hypothetical protein DPMN_052084 [Dreissena polymorpha]|uniref:Uncharacterized protein n=1 Tax=Dreissena polymorpha TaxID=45954 RepID=A0A9D4CK79_DREPO|nr:hypothetical protein DPMN_052084 [Dreissena polymorpha]